MGSVYLSFAPGGRPVAVKVIRREFADDPEFRERFARETRAAERVNGIHVAHLIEAGEEDGVPWMATVYVAGPSLAEAVRECGPLPVESVQAVTVAIARALQAIHAAGIVHRDLKPANVVLGPDGPRVIDFGVARAADGTTLSLSGMRVGTPQYTPPEQIGGDPVTPASDVFALGALVYFVATGRPAFGEGNDFSVVHRIMNLEPALEGCPSELLPLLRGCLAKDPAARPTTHDIIDAWSQAPGVLPAQVGRAVEARKAALGTLAATPATLPSPPGSTGPGSTVVDRRPRGTLMKWGAAAAAVMLIGGVAIGVKLASALDSPSDGNSGDRASTPPVTAVTPPVDSSRPAPASTGPDPLAPVATPTTDPVQYTGPISFGFDGIELDTVPPNKRGTIDIGTVFACDLCTLGTEDDDLHLAVWKGRELPTRQQCSDLVDTQGYEQWEGVKKNDLVCVQTTGGRIALLRIKRFDESQVDATAKVWAEIRE